MSAASSHEIILNSQPHYIRETIIVISMACAFLWLYLKVNSVFLSLEWYAVLC